MKISVITAVFNAHETVAETIDSALAQTYPDVELIVIDGGSSDGTLEILANYKKQLSVLVSEPDAGIYDALNKGIFYATGDVIGFLHADDVFAEITVLEDIAKAFSERGVDAVYGDLNYVSKRHVDRVVRYWKAGHYTPGKLQQGWMPPHPTFYVRRSLYEQWGGFDVSYRIAADYDCILRILIQGRAHCHYLPKVLVTMRLGGASNRSLANIVRKSREDYRALKANGVGGMGTLLWKNLSKLRQFFG